MAPRTGSTSRTGQLQAYVSARVIQVFPNGDLGIEGVKEVTVNRERQILRIRGIVRTRDVSPNNVVLSTGMVNMRRFERRTHEILVLSELLDRSVRLRSNGQQATIVDAAMERNRTQDWLITRLAVRVGEHEARVAAEAAEPRDLGQTACQQRGLRVASLLWQAAARPRGSAPSTPSRFALGSWLAVDYVLPRKSQ